MAKRCRSPPSPGFGAPLRCTSSQRTFTLQDPLFVDKVRDIVGLYLILRRSLVCASMRSPRSRRWTEPHRCCRCDQGRLNVAPMTTASWPTSLFAALDVATGKSLAPPSASSGHGVPYPDARCRGGERLDVHLIWTTTQLTKRLHQRWLPSALAIIAFTPTGAPIN